MSIPNEALQKLLQEIETRALISQQQLSLVRSQIAQKQRDARVVQLTDEELAALPPSANLYEGVGKMFVLEDRKAVRERLKREKAGCEDEVKDLGNRLQYLETTYEKAKENMDAILKGGRR